MKSVSRQAPPRTEFFDWIANRITHLTGSSGAFLTAFTVVLVWALTGPLFTYSEDWQLVINTGTTIVTFLMVFIIQNRVAGASSE